MEQEAENAFNEVLSKREGHNGLVLLSEAGWEELFPEPDFWSFTHSNYPGVIIRWTHGTNYGRAVKRCEE